MKYRFALVFVCALALTGVAYAGVDIDTDMPPPPTATTAPVTGPETSLGAAMAKHNRFFGAAFMSDYLLYEPQYNATFSEQFTIATSENRCKWFNVQPQQGVFDFAKCDAALKVAEDRNMKFRGHNLCWYAGNPQWLSANAGNVDALTNILKSHVWNAVARYGDRMYAWDVVNEAINDDLSQGTLRGPGMNPGNNIWASIPDHLDVAFWTADAARRNVSSAVKLFYNDYHVEGLGPKSEAMYSVLKDLKGRKVPIDGVGMQMHIMVDGKGDMQPAPADIKANMQRLAALGLEIHVTEMDVICNNCVGDRLLTQAAVYRDILRVCLEVEACKSFETWGFTDKYSWLYNDAFGQNCPGKACAPLIFDSNYAMKPAAIEMLKLLNGER